MARPLTPLGTLGERVATAFEDDGGGRARAIEAARREFAVQSLLPTRVQPRLFTGLAWGAAAAACLALGVFAWEQRSAPLEFDVNGSAGVAQTWLAAPSARQLVVSFSDGSVLNVDPRARARVVGTDAHGADIALESGSLHAQVGRTPESAWRLIAGPFAVRATGSRFDVTWAPATQQFSLAVLEGSAIVSGSIAGAERPVRAGERLFASVVQGRLELMTAETAAAQTEQGREPERAQTDSGAAPPAAAAAVAPASSAREAGSSWRELASSGDLRQAFSAAEAQGFAGACDSASAAELLLLGDAARLSGRSDRANEALLALRRRYPHDTRRAAAAFALGKVAFDQRRAYGEAAKWFATCMREQPNGPLSREASGRRIEALRNTGDAAGARQAAQDYLGRYPDGPHADLARSVTK